MNTLQLIKARTARSRAVQLARLQMAKAFRVPEHTDAVHTPVGRTAKSRLRYRGVAYEPVKDQQQALGGRDLRYRGVTYGLY